MSARKGPAMTNTDNPAVIAAAMAGMRETGCGLTIDGKHVLCCDESVKDRTGAYGEPLYCEPDACDCLRFAIAVRAHLQETRHAE